MKLSTILLAFVLLDAGNVCAQEVGPEKKATAYMVADAHLDTQWNWDIQTTIKEYVWNTLSRNLFLLKKYPNYIFNFVSNDTLPYSLFIDGKEAKSESTPHSIVTWVF